ncbi:MAG: hypothetical protein K9I69_06505 [Ignavibacteriales bacterium]|nr:hypothetical protein [Ignavibacteriales bacterium]
MGVVRSIFVNSARNIYYNKKFIVLLWATNSVFALVLSAPVFYIIRDNLGDSFVNQSITLSFDYLWYLQLRYLYKNIFGTLPILIISAVSVYAFIQSFFAGGLLSVFNNPTKNHMVDLFYGGVKYWYRFSVIFVISVFFLTLSFIFNAYSGDIIGWLLGDEYLLTWEIILRALRYIFLFFLIAMVIIISDYCRVVIVMSDEVKFHKVIFQSLNFIRLHSVRTLLIFLVTAFIAALGMMLYNFLGKFVPSYPWYFMLLSFLLQQILVIFRIIIRLMFFSTEVLNYKDLTAKVVEA